MRRTRWFALIAVTSVGLAFACLFVSSQFQPALAMKRALVLSGIVFGLIGASALGVLVVGLGRGALASIRARQVGMGILQLAGAIVLALAAVAIGVFELDMLGFLMFWES